MNLVFVDIVSDSYILMSMVSLMTRSIHFPFLLSYVYIYDASLFLHNYVCFSKGVLHTVFKPCLTANLDDDTRTMGKGFVESVMF